MVNFVARKERQILKLAFLQDFIGTEPTDTSANSIGGSIKRHVVSPSLLL